LIQYRIGRATHRYTIGLHGKFTPEEARRRAEKLLQAVADGLDPQEMRKEARAALTVAELADMYLGPEGKADKPNKKASSWDTDGRVIRRHVIPLLGKKVAKSITSDDIKRFQAEVTAGKTAVDEKMGFRKRAIVKGGKSVARLATVVLGAMLQFGVKHGALPVNPAKGVELNKNEKRERFLSEKEVATIAEGMTILEGLHMLHPTIATAIRLLMVTGCRKNEIASLKWAWVDFERGCLRLPDSKTGAKVVPMAAAALKMLADLPRKSEWVLPATTGDGHIVGLQRAWETIREWCGLEEVRIHDLRHSFASFAAADGASLYLIGKVLGHSQTRTTEKYAHLADDPLRAVADRAASRIANALGMRPEDNTSGEVIPLRKN
jgi:integrase